MGHQGAFWGDELLPNLDTAYTCVFSLWKFTELFVYAERTYWKYISYQQNVFKKMNEKAKLPSKILMGFVWLNSGRLRPAPALLPFEIRCRRGLSSHSEGGGSAGRVIHLSSESI